MMEGSPRAWRPEDRHRLHAELDLLLIRCGRMYPDQRHMPSHPEKGSTSDFYPLERIAAHYARVDEGLAKP